MNWTTKKVKVSDLTLLDNNPRTITEHEIKRLVKSLKDNGNFKPIIVNKDLTVLGGNQRLRALQSIGITEVLASVPEKQLTEKEVKRIVLLDNDHNGEFDISALANEFEDAIRDIEMDFSLPPEEPEIDENDLEDAQKVYEEGNIKQIVLYYSADEYELVYEKLTAVSEKEGIQGNSELFTFLLSHYERNST